MLTFWTRHSIIGNSYSSKSCHSHVGYFPPRGCMLNYGRPYAIETQASEACVSGILGSRMHRELEELHSVFGTRFGPMSMHPFCHLSQVSFGLSHLNLLIGDTPKHLSLGTSHHFPIYHCTSSHISCTFPLIYYYFHYFPWYIGCLYISQYFLTVL